MALLTAPAANRLRTAGVLMEDRMAHRTAHFLDVFLKHKPEQHQIPQHHTKSCAMSKAAASVRVESVYYRFFKTRCEREYKHT